MAKQQLVGVVFLSSEEKAMREGGFAGFDAFVASMQHVQRACCSDTQSKVCGPKEYLYFDTIGCKVGDQVVVEANGSLALARITSIYEDTIMPEGKAIKNVVSKIESSYTKAKAEKARKLARIAEIEKELETIHDGYAPFEIFRILAGSNETVAALLKELDELTEVKE